MIIGMKTHIREKSKKIWRKISLLQAAIGHKTISAASRWLLKESPPKRAYLCDYPQICQKIVPGDVLLVEGRSRISRIIKSITQSPWSHAMLYIGRVNDIQDPALQKILQKKCHYPSNTQLLIESEIGFGTIISPLEKYSYDHIRILRPQGLSNRDAELVIAFAVGRLGAHYNVKHVFDLARFLVPWSFVPKKWGSYIFEHSASQPLEDICSSMLAEAFQSIQFPILPLATLNGEQHVELIERNPRLFTPSDFDFSPYFSVIKYPIFPVNEKGYYQHLPWKRKMMSNDFEVVQLPNTKPD